MQGKIGILLLALWLGFPASAELNPCPYEVLGGTIATTPKDMERLDAVRQWFAQTARTHGTNPKAMVELFKSEQIVPKDGVMHVVGPNLNFYEWLVPVLARKDIKVIVSEPADVLELNVDAKGQLTRLFWSHLSENNPKLLEEAGFGGEEGKVELQKVIDAQVRFVPSVTDQTFGDQTPIPKADLVLVRGPRHGSWHFHQQTKPGSLVWMMTEPFNAPKIVAPSEGDLQNFLPPDREMVEKNRFSGMNLVFKPYFWIAGPIRER